MANAQYTVGNADVGAETFPVPGAVSSDSSFQVEPEGLAKSRHWYVHVENGFDASVDVTIQGTNFNDEGMTAPASDGATETISAGATAAFDGTTGHSYLRLSLTTNTDPTNGELTVTFQSREK